MTLARVRIRLTHLAAAAYAGPARVAFFHVRRAARDELGIDDAIFSARGDVVFADLASAHRLALAVNRARGASREQALQASQLNAMGLIHEIFHVVVARYQQANAGDVFGALAARLHAEHGAELDRTLHAFVDAFPPPAVHRGEQTPSTWLGASSDGIANRQWALEEMLLAWLGNENPAYAPIAFMVSDADLRATTKYGELIASTRRFFDEQPKFGPSNESLVDMLLAPIRHSPGSLLGQLEFMRDRWGLDVDLLRKLLLATDFVKEEGKWFLRTAHGKGDESPAPPVFRGEYYDAEPERFSADKDWMPRVVMVAKSTFVWLDQLARAYGRAIHTLAEVPDEELDRLAERGFTGLWLIGIWKRSAASLRIKQRMGNADAVASAYSLADYEIAAELGGWDAYRSLRDRAARRGIRLASDMVPNHMGIDSRWVIEHPDWFISTREPPFPGYTFNGPDLCDDGRVGVVLEDGYWNHSDAAVVFKRFDKHSGDTRFVYHGNDGTSMPWNDTAQLDYTRADVREAVIQTILHVARLFPIIRFDAAMTLAKRHYQRLWFPLPGSGGDIPSRAAFAMTRERFDEVFPVEFWREVVDRVAREVPDTLLLAEAFWMMEGYFVRTLGMHRVYNSAFMNMLKKEENASYRASIKNVLLFNPQILKRYVNFMNNPDEDTAIAQFGRDDKYFGVCTLMCTMPGLPMFGHGQIEGLHEKYGMEYRRPKWDERPDEGLVSRHAREIFPLLHRRALFSDVENFYLYDVFTEAGHVDEDVFAYSNMRDGERALVVVHNKFKETRGWIRTSVGYLDGSGNVAQKTLGDGLALDGREGRFVIFRDHASALEHVRDAREIHEKGLFVQLGAFKYHVFWGFREVVHTADAPWADLARKLDGRGVPSMDDALVDMVFAPLYDALVRGIGGDDDALAGRELAKDARGKLAARLARAKDDAEERWIRAWALAGALGAFDASHLGRPIARAWREAGADDAAARDAASTVRLALRAAELEKTADPARALGALLDDADARAFLGVNAYEGVEYVRKEPLEALARALEAAARADAEGAARAKPRESAAGGAGKTGAGIAELAARAGYRVDLLRGLLAPRAPAASSAPPAPARTPAPPRTPAPRAPKPKK